MNIPALRAIRIAHPEATITLLTKDWVGGVFENNPDVDRIITLERKDLRRIFGPWFLADKLLPEDFDKAYILPNSFSSALSPFISEIPQRIGYDRHGRGFLLTDAVQPTPERLTCHQVFYYLALVPEIQLSDEDCHPRLYLNEVEKEHAEQMLSDEGISIKENTFIGVAPGAVYGPAKRWPADRFASTLSQLAKTSGRQFLIFGSEKEREIGELIRINADADCVNFAGRTSLRELIALVDMCSAFLTNDSGAMHIASALQVPIVAIFGSTNPTTTPPFGDNHILIRHPMDCSPCLRRECPTDFKCMLDIDPKEVVEACERQLARE